MIFKLLKNEFIKMVHSKKFFILIAFITFMILAIAYMIHVQQINILNNTSNSLKYPDEIRKDILNMDSVIFLKQFTIEFIFRTVVPYFVFFMVVFSVEVFGEDFFSGNMKYFIRLDKNRGKVFNAKVLVLIMYSFLVVAITLILGFIISALAFQVSFKGLGRISIIYLSSVIPVSSFGVMIGIMSMHIKNKNITITLGIVTSIFLTISDRLTFTSNFSPIGVLGLMDKVRAQSINLNSLLICNVVAVIYFVTAYFVGKKIFKNKEFNY